LVVDRIVKSEHYILEGKYLKMIGLTAAERSESQKELVMTYR